MLAQKQQVITHAEWEESCRISTRHEVGAENGGAGQMLSVLQLMSHTCMNPFELGDVDRDRALDAIEQFFDTHDSERNQVPAVSWPVLVVAGAAIAGLIWFAYRLWRRSQPYLTAKEKRNLEKRQQKRK
jgi:hypothetical protein